MRSPLGRVSPAFSALSTAAAMTLILALPAQAEKPGRYIVSGVEANDMLKMRAGPGSGYRILLGLPNGTEVQLQSCESSGGHRWCRITLSDFRGVKGYVSGAYLRKD